ncbi:hypothetical protein BSF33_13370 [Staphylococcus ureilyticus]|nr:hypothetical protein BSF33_13370 [Staphylococcus ureilyticus]
MNMKYVELWVSLYNNIKEIWIIILVSCGITFINFLRSKELYQTNNWKIKSVFKRIGEYIGIAFVSLVYLLIMIALSFVPYPKSEVSNYISDWNNIGSFVILIIIYAMLFPIVILPIFGKREGRIYFIEIVNNYIVKREVLGVIENNDKDKLVLKDNDGFKTIKNVKNISDLKFEEKDRKPWVSKTDIKSLGCQFRNKSKIKRIIFFGLILCFPTGYLAWNVPSIIDIFNKLEHWSEIFMYIGLFTLPLILIIELYYVAYITYRSLFNRN